eukprot:GHVU01147656.1.p1 GENE.GHVU01147656.1~~GHVU01147656.1.p1  ORF type:complete len:151 (+),score=24.69 GHVU01147656.1:523-975(+)
MTELEEDSRKHIADMLLTQFIVEGAQASAIVEDKSLRELLHSLDPSYEIPTIDTIDRLRGHVDDWKANREPLIVRKKYKKKKINVKWGSQTAGQSALSGGTPRARKVQTALMDGRGTSISSMTTNASVLEQQREFIANNSIDINHMTRAA